MKHRINAPPSRVFLGKLRRLPAGLAQWRFRTPARPAGGSTCYLFAGARRFFLSQLPSLESCNLADDSIISLSPLGCATATAAPLPPHAPPRLQRSAACPRGVAGAPGASGAQALRAGGHTARRAAASALPPETFKWSGLSSAQRTTLSNCFPFYSQAGS